MKLKYSALVIVCLPLLNGCTMPGAGAEYVDIAQKQSSAATKMMDEHSLKGTKDSVFYEVNTAIVLGKPFKIKDTQTLPPVFYADAGFRKFESQKLDSVIEFLNRKYSRYGVAIGFTSDALEYLGGNTKQSTKSAVGTDDSSGVYQTVSANIDSTGLLSNANIRMSLDLTEPTNLTQILDSIAARTNLWWRFSNGRVEFYRVESRDYRVDQYPSELGLKSSIASTSGGSSSGDGTSSTSSSSHTYTMSNSQGNALEQLADAIKNNLSPMGRSSFMPALGLINVVDTPTVLDRIQSVVDSSNYLAGRQIRMELEIWELVTTDESNYGIESAIKYSNDNLDFGFSGVSLGDTASLGSLGFKSTGGAFKNTELALKALQGTRSLSLKNRTSLTTRHNGVAPIQFVNERGYTKNVPTSSSGDIVTKGLETATTTNGIVLFASPKLNSDGTIDIQVVTDISSLNSLEPFKDGENTVMLPDRTVSSMVSERRVKPGQTIIMTGFEQSTDNSSNSSVLGEMLWWLGGNDKSESARAVMLIVITPYVEDVA
ncbi:hypothetical protein FG475_15220 [Vibrio navarrensis]|nr:hypothetical protein [Vibrio navarrensis]HDY8121379.1 hypothetical protein [Vibrio vulnificus]